MFFDKMSGYKIEEKRFKKKRGFSLNLNKPLTFSEKVIWKKLYDRNPLLTLTADKYKVRNYIKEVLGKEEAEKILVPLLYVTDNPETIPFDTLPESYIIKANHGCGWNIIVNNNTNIDRKKIISTCKKWLKQWYGLIQNEWAYKDIERKILIEVLLKDENGEIPRDYKFFVFHGVCRKIMVFAGRHSGQDKSIITYDRSWNYLPKSNTEICSQNTEKPKTHKKMIELAERLGKPFDFVRVDLYTIDEKIYFGELTHYPMSGSSLRISPENDMEIGKYWDLKMNKYWNGIKRG